VGVIAILAILLASIVGAYLRWGQAGGVDGAVGILASGLSHARELAITRRDTTGLVCGNSAVPGHAARGYFVLVLVTNQGGVAAQAGFDLAPTNYLPGDVQFNFHDFVFPEERSPVVLFTPEGRAWLPDLSPLDPNALIFELVSPHGGRPLSRYVRIDPLTGIASVLQNEK